MKFLFNLEFPQFHLLNPTQFLAELKKSGVQLQEKDLEYYDKKGIIRPCLRLNRPIINREGQKYATLSLGSPHNWKWLYKKGHIELPKEGDFKPWRHYLDKKEEKTWLFYHPWQILFVKNQTFGEITRIYGRSFLSKNFNVKKFAEYEKQRHHRWLKNMKQKSCEEYNRIIGLLMLLEEPYAIELTNRFYPNPDDKKSFTKWQKWKKKKFSPKKILKQSNLSLEKIKEIYGHMVFDANRLDPINMWNPLPDIIKRGKKLKLRGDALLAQDYFDALQLISFFVKDLTRKPMPSPLDSGEWNTGWKEMVYGKPYDLNSEKTKNRIISDFLKKRPIITSIIYEGPTEDNAIRRIMKAVDIANPEKQGIHLYNVFGSGNMNQKNLDGYVTRANLEENDVYVIIDKDAEKYLQKHMESGAIKQANCTIWKNDFELDNFGIEKVVNKINSVLRKNGKKPITNKEVENEMKSRALFEAVKSAVYKKQKFELEKLITKPELTLQILKPRIKQIRKEYLDKGWTPVYPIEKILKSILRTVPKYIDYV